MGVEPLWYPTRKADEVLADLTGAFSRGDCSGRGSIVVEAALAPAPAAHYATRARAGPRTARAADGEDVRLTIVYFPTNGRARLARRGPGSPLRMIFAWWGERPLLQEHSQVWGEVALKRFGAERQKEKSNVGF